MTEGVALHELVYEAGEPVDYRVLDVNPAYVNQTGIHPAKVIGKPASVAYGTGEPPYLAEFERAVRGTKPVEFETYFPPLGRHFRVSAVATGPHHFATVFEDITRQKHREAEILRQEELLDLATDAILIWELNGAIEYWNEAAAELYACPAEEALGSVSHDLLATVFPESLSAVLAALERDGAWAGELEHTACDGRRVAVDSRMRLVESEGRRLVLETDRDISGRRRTEAELRRLVAAETEAKREALSELERTNVLLRAADALASSMEPLSVLETLADLTLQSLHRSRLVILGYDEQTHTLETLLTRGRPAPPAGTRLRLEQLSAPLQEAVREHRTVVVDYDRTEFPEEVRKIVGETKARLALWIPVVWQDKLLGLIGIDEPGEHRPITPREVELVEAICAQAAVSLANAGRFEVQRVIAATLQRSFRHPMPQVRNFDVGLVEAPASEPGLVGGDFWDVLTLPDGRVFVLIGDVAGKGIVAAGMTETVRSMVRAFASIDPMPAFVLRKTNELLLREPSEVFTTALVAVIDPDSGRVAFGSAGHPGPTLLGTSTCRVVNPSYGPPLGTFAAEYPTTEVELGAGEYLILYTDGVTEARSGAELFGEQGVVRAGCELRGADAQDVAEEIARSATSFASELMDDLQVLVLRRAPQGRA
jgi:PAS domain S-box-containing protein